MIYQTLLMYFVILSPLKETRNSISILGFISLHFSVFFFSCCFSELLQIYLFKIRRHALMQYNICRRTILYNINMVLNFGFKVTKAFEKFMYKWDNLSTDKKKNSLNDEHLWMGIWTDRVCVYIYILTWVSGPVCEHLNLSHGL